MIEIIFGLVIVLGLVIYFKNPHEWNKTIEEKFNSIKNQQTSSRHHQQQRQRQTGYQFSPSQYEYQATTQARHQKNFERFQLDESAFIGLKLVFLIDISGSMQEEDVDPEGVSRDGVYGRGKWTRYDNMAKLLRNMVGQMFEINSESSIPLYFFNNTVKRLDVNSPRQLMDNISSHLPNGSTAMHLALEQATKNHVNEKDKVLFIIFTDGAPDDAPAVSRIIGRNIYARDPEGNRLNLLFVRFGDDQAAMQFLEDQDNNPTYGDSVDHKSDNAAYALGVKLLIYNALFETVENDSEWSATLSKLP